MRFSQWWSCKTNAPGAFWASMCDPYGEISIQGDFDCWWIPFSDYYTTACGKTICKSSRRESCAFYFVSLLCVLPDFLGKTCSPTTSLQHQKFMIFFHATTQWRQQEKFQEMFLAEEDGFCLKYASKVLILVIKKRHAFTEWWQLFLRGKENRRILVERNQFNSRICCCCWNPTSLLGDRRVEVFDSLCRIQLMRWTTWINGRFVFDVKQLQGKADNVIPNFVFSFSFFVRITTQGNVPWVKREGGSAIMISTCLTKFGSLQLAVGFWNWSLPQHCFLVGAVTRMGDGPWQLIDV